MVQTLAARWPELQVGLVHGRLKPEERDQVMRRFRRGELNVLVATTVIEVGIDVPDATIMVIEHPDRFGLAQLHQLRGRIGRGAEESYCILLVDGPAPDRLQGFAATLDGFKIAELDLAERGMGDLIGARQSGGFELRHARLPDDSDLLTRARELATNIIAADPALQRRENQRLRERAVARYPRAVERRAQERAPTARRRADQIRQLRPSEPGSRTHKTSRIHGQCLPNQLCLLRW
jgi:ATP-dependent DNA helicase RecG